MKYYSDFSKKYVQDICNALNSEGLLIDKASRIFYRSDLDDYQKRGLVMGETSGFGPECFDNLTDFLQGTVVNKANIYQILNTKGLVNRGYCPYTGEAINNSGASWEYFGRKVYVSRAGLEIMKKEADANYEKIMGKPAPQRSNASQNKGCLLAIIAIISIGVIGCVLI